MGILVSSLAHTFGCCCIYCVGSSSVRQLPKVSYTSICRRTEVDTHAFLLYGFSIQSFSKLVFRVSRPNSFIMCSKKFSPERRFTNCLQGKALRLFLLLAFVLGQQAASFAQSRSLLSPMADKAKISTVQPYGMGGTYYPMVNGLRYIFEYPYATVTNYYGGKDIYTNEYQGSITVPEKVTYSTQTYTVNCIGKRAFCFSYLMTDISLPNTIEKIDSMAFQQCLSLTSIEIPNSVKNLNYGAFSGCI